MTPIQELIFEARDSRYLIKLYYKSRGERDVQYSGKVIKHTRVTETDFWTDVRTTIATYTANKPLIKYLIKYRVSDNYLTKYRKKVKRVTFFINNTSLKGVPQHNYS